MKLRHILIASALFFLFNIISYSQYGPIIPEFKDYYKGLTDNEYLRVILLENEFYYYSTIELPYARENDDRSLTAKIERWGIQFQRDTDILDAITVDITNLYFENSPVRKGNQILVRISKWVDVNNEYIEQLKRSIAEHYEKKKSVRFEFSDNYYLKYYWDKELTETNVLGWKNDMWSFEIKYHGY